MTVKLTQFVSDHLKLEEKLEKNEQRMLYKVGAYALTTMRRSFRKAGKKKNQVSSPGQPPRRHGGTNEGLGHANFIVSKPDKSVAMGPFLHNDSGRSQNYPVQGAVTTIVASKSVPQLLNEGGAAQSTTTYASGVVTHKTLNYEARPFTEGVLEKSKRRLMELMEKGLLR